LEACSLALVVLGWLLYVVAVVTVVGVVLAEVVVVTGGNVGHGVCDGVEAWVVNTVETGHSLLIWFIMLDAFLQLKLTHSSNFCASVIGVCSLSLLRPTLKPMITAAKAMTNKLMVMKPVFLFMNIKNGFVVPISLRK
jgi:hypothetical protein